MLKEVTNDPKLLLLDLQQTLSTTDRKLYHQEGKPEVKLVSEVCKDDILFCEKNMKTGLGIVRQKNLDISIMVNGRMAVKCNYLDKKTERISN